MILAEISISEQDSPASFLLIFIIVSRLLNADKASWHYRYTLLLRNKLVVGKMCWALHLTIKTTWI